MPQNRILDVQQSGRRTARAGNLEGLFQAGMPVCSNPVGNRRVDTAPR